MSGDIVLFRVILIFFLFNVNSYARENSLSYCKLANIVVFTTLQVISHVNTSYDPSSAKKTVQGSKVCAEVFSQNSLSKARRKPGDQVLTLNLCCCQRQLAPFPVATCRRFTPLAAERAKLQATICYYWKQPKLYDP